MSNRFRQALVAGVFGGNANAFWLFNVPDWTSESDQADALFGLTAAEARVAAPKAAMIPPAPPTAIKVEALSPLPRPKQTVDTPATRPQANRAVGGSRRPP